MVAIEFRSLQHVVCDVNMAQFAHIYRYPVLETDGEPRTAHARAARRSGEESKTL